MKRRVTTEHLILAASISLALCSSLVQAAVDEGSTTVMPTTSTEDGEQALQDIEARRNQIQAEILATFAYQMEDGGKQLANALKRATPAQLQTAQKASTLNELNAALNGTSIDNNPGSTAARSIRTIGDLDKDFTFTPVAPCRLVDTRKAGGQLIPNETREFYLYGSGSDLSPQGGVSTGCASPDGGEPYGAILNITTIGQVGEGTLSVYPANEAAPSVGNIVYYKSSSQIISNTAPVKAFRSLGPKEIEVKNRFGQAHFVIDVLGYYYAPSVPVGVEYTGGNHSTSLTSTAITVRSIAVNMPTDGHCVINASGYFGLDADNSIARCTITTGNTVDTDHAIYGYLSGTGLLPMAGTRGFAHPSGTRNYNLVCDETGGNARIADTHLSATCAANKY